MIGWNLYLTLKNIEQDIKKNDLQEKDHRIPDLIVQDSPENFIIEYERSLKNADKYEEMYNYHKKNNDKHHVA